MKKLLRSVLCSVLTIAMIIPLTVVSASAAKLKISRTKADVPVGYSITLKVTGASNVKWSSDDESVAEVKANGASAKIYGIKTGSATISAKVGKTALKCKVTVKSSFITPSKEKITLNKGESKTITLKVVGSKEITLSNSDKDVCSTSWGKWDGNTIKLTIKAKSAGMSTIKIYEKNNSGSTAKSVVVSVGGDELFEDDISDNGGKSGDPEGDVVELVNKERRAAGKGALKTDNKLNEIAAIRAKELAKKFSHDRPDGRDCFTAFDEAGYTNYMAVAENIAYTYSDSAEEVMDMWMNSSGHKANILDGSLTKIGVGYYEEGGRCYWVQVFAG